MHTLSVLNGDSAHSLLMHSKPTTHSEANAQATPSGLRALQVVSQYPLEPQDCSPRSQLPRTVATRSRPRADDGRGQKPAAAIFPE